MRRIRKSWCLLLLAGCLCGCALNQEQTAAIPEKSIYRQSDSETGITLSIYYGTIYNARMMNAIAEDYKAATGITIAWQAADSGTNVLKQKFAKGDAPDLFSMAEFNIPQWKDYLADLSAEPWTGDVYPNSLDAGSVNGKLYACGN